MKTFTELFNSTLAGNRETSRKAAREVHALLYGWNGNQREAVTAIVESAPQEYGKIKEDWRQENFVMAVSVLYYVGNKKDRPDFLFPWLHDLLQHKNGNIRHAAVRMLETELGPLTVHIRFPDEKSSYERDISAEQADMVLFELYANMTELAEDLRKPAYEKYKYISSLPSSPYKSVQMVLGILIDLCGEEYMARLEDSYRKVEIMEDRKRVIAQVTEGGVLLKTALVLAQSRLKQMRADLETNMLPLIAEVYPKFDMNSTVSLVYEGNLTLEKLLVLIKDSVNLETQTVEHRNLFMDFISMVWNLYPHKELEDYSPYEIAGMYEMIKNKGTGNKEYMDHAIVEKIKNAGYQRSGIWEADFAPGLITIPGSNIITLLIVHQESYFVLTMHAVKEVDHEEFIKAFLEGVQKNKILPDVLMVNKEELRETFGTLATKLNFKIEMVNALKAIPIVRRDMNSFFKDN